MHTVVALPESVVTAPSIVPVVPEAAMELGCSQTEANVQEHPYKRNPPQPHITPDGEIVHTVDSLTHLCLLMDASRAAQNNDIDLCVTPIINKLYHENQIINLRLVDGKWAANETRVSSEGQRSGLTHATSRLQSNGSKSKKDSGHSEEEQIRRAIWYFLKSGYAFRIYNDSGLTGEFPYNNPELIRELSKKKAERYERIFRKVMLDQISLQRYNPTQVQGLENYLKKRLTSILNGALSDEENYTKGQTIEEENAKVLRRGRPRTKPNYRPGFSQLWEHIDKDQVFLMTATDRSRICRDADLELA